MEYVSNMPSIIVSTAALAISRQFQTVYADYCSVPSSSMTIQGSAEAAKICPDFKDDQDQNACCPSQINQGSYYCCTTEQKATLEAKLAADARREFISNHIPEVVFCAIFFSIIFTVFGVAVCKRIQMCKQKLSCSSSCESTPRTSLRRHTAQRSQHHHHHSRSSQRGIFGTDRSPLSFTRRGFSTYPYQNNIIPLPRDTSLSKPISVNDAPPPYEIVIGQASAEGRTTPPSDFPATAPPIQDDVNGVSGETSNDWNCLIENVLNSERDRNLMTSNSS